MQSLTPRQQEILSLIRQFVEDTGYPPTRSEIAGALGFRSANAAEQHLRALAKKGAIELQGGASRGIRLVEELGLPVVGRVAAGSPLLAEEHIDRHVQLPVNLFSPRADYLLKVRGMSMKDIGIMDGDLLAVHKTVEVRNGQIVVARLQDEVTVKRLHRQGHRVQLLPENDEFQPIEVDLRHDPLDIEGIGVGILRPEL
ncbi:transcriptional repressor LexA [Ectothiorhodospiraceae bacterium WFHF3C12]|nr:transcriptional repressor LexA [Ectothiorhodospiraceae bacterium WFHF3C12]